MYDPTQKPVSLAILIPYSRGFDIFSKSPAGDLRRLASSDDPRRIFQAVLKLPTPRVAIHLGRAYDSFLGRLVLHETELCVIPTSWTRHIPLSRVAARARFAVQLFEAYISDPIRLFGAKQIAP